MTMNNDVLLTIFIILSVFEFVAVVMFILERNKMKSQLANASTLEMEYAKALATEKTRADAVAEDLKKSEEERKTLEQSKTDAQIKLATSEEKIAHLTERLENRAEEERAVREKFASDFENLSNKMLESAREKLSSSNIEQMGLVLAPLKNSLSEFRQRMEALGEVGARNNASMSAHIESLVKMNAQLGEEAKNLSNALRSKNKVAGNWGETILERIFENCGFVEGIHYQSQKNYIDKEGSQKRLMPDFVVYLPNERSIVVDSKLSLVDYTDYCSADDQTAKRTAITKFKRSVREHLNEFAGKYNDLSDITCSFKMMFMPIEGAYELAISVDEKLLSDAYQANVLIVSPTNVLSILKFAEIAYRNEAFAKNLKELYNTGRLLHQRVELFSERFEKLGNKIVGLQKDFDDTKKTLSQGSKSVLETANRFIEKSKNANIDFEEEKDDE